jgi:hypothetical protein
MVKWKKVCVECGKKIYVGDGVLTEWRDSQKLSQPTFFCLKCIKRIEKEGRDKRNAEALTFRESLQQENQLPYKQRFDQALIEILKKLCSIPDWYALMAITNSCNELFPDTDSMTVSNSLLRLGFTQRARKKRGSYTYVFIDPKKIPAGDVS